MQLVRKTAVHAAICSCRGCDTIIEYTENSIEEMTLLDKWLHSNSVIANRSRGE